jgi:1,4-alpha-glucan branching enzyme
MAGSFVLILHTHLPYVLNHGTWPHGSDWLTEAAAECYIPLLNECHALAADGITPGITFSMTPVLVEQLADPAFARLFVDYLDERAEAARRDQVELAGDPHMTWLAGWWAAWYRARRDDFTGRYASDLVGAFADLHERGQIGLQTAGATHGYFPLLGRDESIDAQLAAAVASHRRHFGAHPRGVWLPECAYRGCYDWRSPIPNAISPVGVRKGVEQLLAQHGLEYTVVDSHLTLGGQARGIWGPRYQAVRDMVESGQRFLPLDDSRSVHDLYRICSTGHPEAGTAAIFTRDTDTTMRVWSGTYGYPGEGNYLEFHKKYHDSGHRYWSVTDSKADLGAKRPYHPDWTDEKVRGHAKHFATIVEQELWKFHASTGRHGTLTAPFDTELFGHWWFEGPRFIGQLLREIDASPIIHARTAAAELDFKDPGMLVQIPEGSWGDGGDHRVWMNDKVNWTWPKIYEIEERFLGLLRTSDRGRERVILEQMAREQMLLQASDWQFLITTESAVDYATKRFEEHYRNASFLAGLVERARNGELIPLADHEELSRLQSIDRIFPDLSLDWWSDEKDSLCAQK